MIQVRDWISFLKNDQLKIGIVITIFVRNYYPNDSIYITTEGTCSTSQIIEIRRDPLKVGPSLETLNKITMGDNK